MMTVEALGKNNFPVFPKSENQQQFNTEQPLPIVVKGIQVEIEEAFRKGQSFTIPLEKLIVHVLSERPLEDIQEASPEYALAKEWVQKAMSNNPFESILSDEFLPILSFLNRGKLFLKTKEFQIEFSKSTLTFSKVMSDRTIIEVLFNDPLSEEELEYCSYFQFSNKSCIADKNQLQVTNPEVSLEDTLKWLLIPNRAPRRPSQTHKLQCELLDWKGKPDPNATYFLLLIDRIIHLRIPLRIKGPDIGLFLPKGSNLEEKALFELIDRLIETQNSELLNALYFGLEAWEIYEGTPSHFTGYLKKEFNRWLIRHPEVIPTDISNKDNCRLPHITVHPSLFDYNFYRLEKSLKEAVKKPEFINFHEPHLFINAQFPISHTIDLFSDEHAVEHLFIHCPIFPKESEAELMLLWYEFVSENMKSPYLNKEASIFEDIIAISLENNVSTFKQRFFKKYSSPWLLLNNGFLAVVDFKDWSQSIPKCSKMRDVRGYFTKNLPYKICNPLYFINILYVNTLKNLGILSIKPSKPPLLVIPQESFIALGSEILWHPKIENITLDQLKKLLTLKRERMVSPKLNREYIVDYQAMSFLKPKLKACNVDLFFEYDVTDFGVLLTNLIHNPIFSSKQRERLEFFLQTYLYLINRALNSEFKTVKTEPDIFETLTPFLAQLSADGECFNTILDMTVTHWVSNPPGPTRSSPLGGLALLHKLETPLDVIYTLLRKCKSVPYLTVMTNLLIETPMRVNLTKKIFVNWVYTFIKQYLYVYVTQELIQYLYHKICTDNSRINLSKYLPIVDFLLQDNWESTINRPSFLDWLTIRNFENAPPFTLKQFVQCFFRNYELSETIPVIRQQKGDLDLHIDRPANTPELITQMLKYAVEDYRSHPKVERRIHFDLWTVQSRHLCISMRHQVGFASLTDLLKFFIPKLSIGNAQQIIITTHLQDIGKTYKLSAVPIYNGFTKQVEDLQIRCVDISPDIFRGTQIQVLLQQQNREALINDFLSMKKYFITTIGSAPLTNDGIVMNLTCGSESTLHLNPLYKSTILYKSEDVTIFTLISREMPSRVFVRGIPYKRLSNFCRPEMPLGIGVDINDPNINFFECLEEAYLNHRQ